MPLSFHLARGRADAGEPAIQLEEDSIGAMPAATLRSESQFQHGICLPAFSPLALQRHISEAGGISHGVSRRVVLSYVDRLKSVFS